VLAARVRSQDFPHFLPDVPGRITARCDSGYSERERPFRESGHFMAALQREVRSNRLQGAEEAVTSDQQPVPNVVLQKRA
jgi:hypothetical protein